MTRASYNLPEPLMTRLGEGGLPLHVVPSAIGLPADLGVTQEAWDAENAELGAEGERLLDRERGHGSSSSTSPLVTTRHQ